jgi:uncharacterized protein YciI
MRHLIWCALRPASGEARAALRLEHLRYMQAHAPRIVAGGPMLGDDGAPTAMVLMTNFATRAEAQAFIDAEPYAASGRVFLTTEVHPWSQVLPETAPGALACAIAAEAARGPAAPR